MMSSAVAFQMNGLGLSFQCSAQSVIASVSSVTLVNRAAAQAFVGEFLEPAFDQVQPGARGGGEVQVPAAAVLVREPVGDLRRRVRGQVVQHHVDGQAAGDGGVDLLEEPQHVGAGVAFAQVGEDLPVATFIAANRSIVPWRL